MSEPAVIAMKAANAPLMALVSTRFWPGFAPQSTGRPAVTYQMIDDVPESAINRDSGVTRARWRFNIWADTYASAIATRAALKATYKRRTGTFGGVVVQDTFFTMYGSEPDDAAPSTSGTPGHLLHADVVMAYAEAV